MLEKAVEALYKHVSSTLSPALGAALGTASAAGAAAAPAQLPSMPMAPPGSDAIVQQQALNGFSPGAGFSPWMPSPYNARTSQKTMAELNNLLK